MSEPWWVAFVMVYLVACTAVPLLICEKVQTGRWIHQPVSFYPPSSRDAGASAITASRATTAASRPATCSRP